jgi:DNA invertase Pin-like site-specific DNA recombinase
LGDGDTLVVTRLDRLGRSLKDLADIGHEIEKAGANLKVLEQHVDTSTSTGRAFFGMLAVFAAFETDVRRERQAEGIAKAKRAGVYKGGVKRIDRARVRALRETGSGPSAIANEMGISRRQVYRILEERQ